MRHSIAKSMLALILVISLLMIGIMTAMTLYEANVFVREAVISRANNAAQMVSRFYSGTVPTTMIQDESVRTELSNTLRSMIKTFQLEYLYIEIPDIDSGQVMFICVEGNEEKRELAKSLPPGTVMAWDISDELASVMRGEISQATRETQNQYGHVFTVYVPLLGQDGAVTAVVGADISASYLAKRFRKALLWRTCFSLAIVMLSAFVMYYVVKRQVIKPAKIISSAMRAFGKNDQYDTPPIVIGGDNEFSHIGTSFNHMAENIRDNIARIKAYTELQNKQEYEFTVASKIQQGFMPEPHYIDTLSEISALMVPAKNIGGDFYDYFVDRNHTVLVIADVSGKGISGAIFMARVISLIRGFVKQGMPPGKVLEAVNFELETSNPNTMFVTAFIAFVDSKEGVIRYANAGHNPPYLLHEGKRKVLSASSGVPLGLFVGETYQTTEEVFPLGSTVFLFTDGVNEAINQNAEFFGTKQLEKILSMTDGANTVSQVKNELDCFTAGSEQSDDITMLSFTSHCQKLTLPTEVPAFSQIRDWILMDDRIPNKMKKRLCLIAEECFVNICSYAYDTAAGIIICHKQTWDDGTVAIQFTDSGKPFDQTKAAIKPEDFDPDFQVGGLGRLIAQSFANRFRYINIEGNNVLLIINYDQEEYS